MRDANSLFTQVLISVKILVRLRTLAESTDARFIVRVKTIQWVSKLTKKHSKAQSLLPRSIHNRFPNNLIINSLFGSAQCSKASNHKASGPRPDRNACNMIIEKKLVVVVIAGCSKASNHKASGPRPYRNVCNMSFC